MRARRPRNLLLTILTHGPLMWMLGCTTFTPQGPLAQFCPSDQTAGSGNLDRPSSVAIARHPSGNAYALAANPDLRQLRAVDLTDGLMVPAPNVYFPMAVKLGSFTEDVAASNDGQVGVALDAADRELRFFHVGTAADASNWTTFKEGSGTIGVDARPTGLAVQGNRDNLLVAISHAGDPTGSLTLLRWSNGRETSRVRVDLGGRPSGVGITDDGATAVVSNADGNSLWIVDTDAPAGLVPPFSACGDGVARPCTLDVGGPTNEVTVGSAAVEPHPSRGRYPVALALRLDRPDVVVARLRFTTNPSVAFEPFDRVEATVRLPRPAAALALAPDPTPMCCQGTTFQQNPETLAQGGFAYGLIALMDGTILYLDLSAKDAGGRRTPRLMDLNPLPPGPPVDPATGVTVDVNTSPNTYQEPGLEPGASTTPSRRPTVELQTLSDGSGNPPLINQFVDDDYVFIWEGYVAGVSNRRGGATPAQIANNIIADEQAQFDFVSRGVRVGDVLEVPPQEGCECPETEPECTTVVALPVVGVAGNQLQLAGTFADRDCLARDEGFIYSVRAADSWVAYGRLTGRSFGRISFFQTVDLPSMRVTIIPAGWQGGRPEPVETRPGETEGQPATVVVQNPPPSGTVLTVPMRSNFDPFRLDPDDTAPDVGRYIAAGAVPTGLTTAVIPVATSSVVGAARVEKAVGILSTAGGGLLIQFDLAVQSSGANGLISRGARDPAFRFYE
ncbi:MAG: hypothetical protein AB2A00_37300 [Myxococcota bacterium]